MLEECLIDLNKNKNLGLIKEHWESEETVSLRDVNHKELEKLSIIECLKKLKGGSLIDIGCGDTSDTVCYCDYVNDVCGFDYSDTMLRKAKEVSKDRIRVSRLDLLEDDISLKADIVTTKRFMVNLGNFENQKRAILKIYDCLNKDGYYLMLECCIDGLNNLNTMRQRVGLGEIEEPFHNTYFELNELTGFVSNHFYIEKVKYFSTYCFLTRVYNHLLEQDIVKKFDDVAKAIHLSFDLLGADIVGPQFLMVLRKK